jgi:hypothetical protein
MDNGKPRALVMKPPPVCGSSSSSSCCDVCGTVGLFQKTTYCERCFRERVGASPDCRKLKETLVVDLVSRGLVEYDETINLVIGKRVVIGTAHGLIPDMMFDVIMGDLVIATVLIEVDENKHNQYKDDEKRTKRLKDSISFLRLIRINPDSSPSYRYGMVERTSTQNERVQETTIIYYAGEIERRQREIKKCLSHVVAQARTDFILRRLAPFEEFRLFFD